MTRYTLRPGINPDLIIGVDGLTVVCYQDINRGFVVERWLVPTMPELLFIQPASLGYGRLKWTGHLAAAFRGADSQAYVWVMGLDGLIVKGPTEGNYPLAWTPDGEIAVQATNGMPVIVEGQKIGQGVGTGLARITGMKGTGYTVVTWDDDYYTNHLDSAHVLANGDRVSQNHDGGVLCRFGGAEGVILLGEGCYEPRVAVQPNGQYTILFGARGSQGALPQTLLTNVSKADFVEIPVAPPIIEPPRPIDPPKPIDPPIRPINPPIVKPPVPTTNSGAVAWKTLHR